MVNFWGANKKNPSLNPGLSNRTSNLLLTKKFVFIVAVLTLLSIHSFFDAVFLYKSLQIRIFDNRSDLQREMFNNPNAFKNDKYKLVGGASPYYKFHYFPGKYCLIEPLKWGNSARIQGDGVNKEEGEFICSALFGALFWPISNILGGLLSVILVYTLFVPLLLFSKLKHILFFYRLSKYILVLYTGVLVVVLLSKIVMFTILNALSSFIL